MQTFSSRFKRMTLYVLSILLVYSISSCMKNENALNAANQAELDGDRSTEKAVDSSQSQARNESDSNASERIVDETGDFVYEGKLKQVGDDDHGYIKVPPEYEFSLEGAAKGILRYSDTTGKGVITLNLFKGMEYVSAATKLYQGIEAQNGLDGLTAATMQPAGYNAKQVYGVNVEGGYFFVAWLIEDPSNPSDCYYLSIEFDPDHKSLMALSSTFLTVKDHSVADK